MVDCPGCGKPMIKRKRGKYLCENDRCPIIFVRCPSMPRKTKVASSSLFSPSRSVGLSPAPKVHLIEV